MLMDIFDHIFRRMQEALEVVLQKDATQTTVKQAQQVVSGARTRLLEQVSVLGIFSSDEESDYAHTNTPRVSTHEAQTDLTPSSLGIELPLGGGRKIKAKKGGKKGRKETKPPPLNHMAPVDPAKVFYVQAIVDSVYQLIEKARQQDVAAAHDSRGEAGEALDSRGQAQTHATGEALEAHERGVSAHLESGSPVLRLLTRHLLVKWGHMDLACRELEELKTTLPCMPDLRSAVFARLCHFFEPLPPEFSRLFLLLKATSWTAHHPRLGWSEEVVSRGLPMGLTGHTPVARDGVVACKWVIPHIQNTCQTLLLRCDLALEWLAARTMTDLDLHESVLPVDLVMIAVTAQLDRKKKELEGVYVTHFPPPLPAVDAPPPTTGTEAPGPFLTLGKIANALGEIGVGAVTDAQALDVLVHLATHCGARAGLSFSHTRIHTQTQTHQIHRHTNTHALSLCLSVSVSLSLFLSLSLSVSLSRSLALAHALSYPHTHTIRSTMRLL